jgi:hypothetical protein
MQSDASLAQHVAHLLTELETSTPRVMTLDGPPADADTSDPPSSSAKNFFSYQGPKQNRVSRLKH